MSSTHRLATYEIRALAVEASVDPRTIKRFLQGETILPLPRSRVVAVLQRLGRTDLLPAPPTPPASEPPAKVA